MLQILLCRLGQPSNLLAYPIALCLASLNPVREPQFVYVLRSESNPKRYITVREPRLSHRDWVRVLDGRDLSAEDPVTATPSIVISRSTARQFFGSTRAVGQVVDWDVDNSAPIPMTVVGVVDDLRNASPDAEPYPEVFVDYRSLLALRDRWGRSPEERDRIAVGFVSLAVHTRGDPASAVPAVTQLVHAVDANAGIDAILPMDRLVASSVARPRFYAVLLSVFAGAAASLAVIGIYGVLAYAVTQRGQEFGIRMALGAQRGQVLALVLRRGLILNTIGIVLGLAGAAVATRVLQGMLFGVTPLDPRTFLAVALMFGLVATFASYLPARRATKVDPLVALRVD